MRLSIGDGCRRGSALDASGSRSIALEVENRGHPETAYQNPETTARHNGVTSQGVVEVLDTERVNVVTMTPGVRALASSSTLDLVGAVGPSER